MQRILTAFTTPFYPIQSFLPCRDTCWVPSFSPTHCSSAQPTHKLALLPLPTFLPYPELPSLLRHFLSPSSSSYTLLCSDIAQTCHTVFPTFLHYPEVPALFRYLLNPSPVLSRPYILSPILLALYNWSNLTCLFTPLTTFSSLYSTWFFYSGISP